MTDVLMQDAAEQLRSACRLEDVQEVVRSSARRLVEAEGATFVLRDDNKGFYADEDAISPLWKGQRFPITECISGWAMLHDDVAVVPDITRDPRIPIEAYRPTFVRSLVMVPIGPRPTGAIGAYWARERRATPEQIALLTALAERTAEALERIGFEGAPFTPARLQATR